MKKIFFIAAIFSATCATAQDKQLFNAEDYLKKKREQSNPNYSPENPLLKTKPFVLPLQHPEQQAVLSHMLPNGNAVYILPQDNMPCVVPNISLQNGIPNAWQGKTEETMPNPGLRKRPLIPGQK
ncbi:MAG TPA: hypothetical protein VF476_13400 [Chitinophagaceae bacterium]